MVVRRTWFVSTLPYPAREFRNHVTSLGWCRSSSIWKPPVKAVTSRIWNSYICCRRCLATLLTWTSWWDRVRLDHDGDEVGTKMTVWWFDVRLRGDGMDRTSWEKSIKVIHVERGHHIGRAQSNEYLPVPVRSTGESNRHQQEVWQPHDLFFGSFWGMEDYFFGISLTEESLKDLQS